MDLKKIFIKDACPTKIGGQAVLDGIMMKGQSRSAVAIRLPDNSLHIKIADIKVANRWSKIPLVRGVVVFGAAMVEGIKTLMYSASVLEAYEGEGAEEIEEDRFSLWLNEKFGKKRAWQLMLIFSVIIALIFSVGFFVIGPTVAVNWLKLLITNEILLNLAEGLLRIVIFVIYILAIAQMEDIKRVFQFHGAEHKCIHCYENGLDLTPSNCQSFYTLHPRCGTSFLMFVMIISLLLFSLLGWPSLIWRIGSRLLLLPVIAGISYELLRFAGKSDSLLVKILSMPGLLLQKLTTNVPTEEQLEVAIAAMKAVIATDYTLGEGLCDNDGRLIYTQEHNSNNVITS